MKEAFKNNLWRSGLTILVLFLCFIVYKALTSTYILHWFAQVLFVAIIAAFGATLLYAIRTEFKNEDEL